VGGTTTDTAVIENGVADICESGATVGGFKTHVKALNIRTEGIGGDSLIQWDKGAFTIGPTRVAPISWLADRSPETAQALDFMQRHLNRYGVSSRNMQILTLLERPNGLSLTPLEEKILALLAQRPMAVDELVHQTGALFAGALGLERLEQNFNIQRCGFTPTDLLHVENRFTRWSRKAALTMGHLLAQICRLDLNEMTANLLARVTEKLTLEILKPQLNGQIDIDTPNPAQCSLCRTLFENMLGGGNRNFTISIKLHLPVIGIGAPIHFFLPPAAAALNAKVVIPDHADVANAVGAITSRIHIRRKIDIISPLPGRYQIVGLAGVKNFSELEEATAHAEARLMEQVRQLARTAGTSETRVDIRQEDRTPSAADGSSIFLGRTLFGQLIGQPDLVLADYQNRAN